MISGLRRRAAHGLAHPSTKSTAAELRAAVSEKVVLVTGASHGIGLATAELLLDHDARVLLVARSGDRLQSLEQRYGIERAHAFPCDLTDEAQVGALPPRLLEAFGTIDVIVSNAGRSIRRSVADSSGRFHDVTRTIAINYLAPVQLLLDLLPMMRDRGGGHIVNVSTIGVLLPPAPRWGPYVASKAAFDTWLRAAAAETSRDQVTATSIYFGLVQTRMSAPTDDFNSVPALLPRGAAEIVADAIVRRPVSIAPGWGRLAGAAAALAPTWSTRIMTRYGERQEDASNKAS